MLLIVKPRSLLRPSESREEIRGCTRVEWGLDLLASCYPYLRLSAYLSIRACIDVCFIPSAMSISNSEVIDRITERLTSRLKEELRSEVRKEELEASRKKVKEASKMEGCVKSQFTDHSAFALNPQPKMEGCVKSSATCTPLLASHSPEFSRLCNRKRYHHPQVSCVRAGADDLPNLL